MVSMVFNGFSMVFQWFSELDFLWVPNVFLQPTQGEIPGRGPSSVSSDLSSTGQNGHGRFGRRRNIATVAGYGRRPMVFTPGFYMFENQARNDVSIGFDVPQIHFWSTGNLNVYIMHKNDCFFHIPIYSPGLLQVFDQLLCAHDWPAVFQEFHPWLKQWIGRAVDHTPGQWIYKWYNWLVVWNMNFIFPYIAPWV